MSTYRNGRLEFEMCAWGSCGSAPAPGIGVCLEHAISTYVWVREQYADKLGDWPIMRAPARQRQPRETPAPQVGGLIYAMRFGNRIKLGFTTNLAERMRSVPNDEVIATMPGTIAQEQLIHQSFRKQCVHGNEWYDADDPAINDFITKYMTPLDKAA